MRQLKIKGWGAGILVCFCLTGFAVYLITLAGWPWWVPPLVLTAGLIALAVIVNNVIKAAEKYTRAAAEAALEISKGRFGALRDSSLRESTERDELFEALMALSAGLEKFTGDLSQTARKQAAGISSARMDDKYIEGAFRDTAKSINAAYGDIARDFEIITAGLSEISEGEPRNSAPALPGDRARIGAVMETLANNIKIFLGEVQNVKQAVSDGRLSYKTETGKFAGGWLRAAIQLNDTLNAVSVPLNALRDAAERLARGDLSPVAEYGYRGEWNALFQTLSQALNAVGAHNKELLAVLNDIAGYTPGQRLHAEYNGAFPAFKQAVNGAAERLLKIPPAGSGTERLANLQAAAAARRTDTERVAARTTAARTDKPAGISGMPGVRKDAASGSSGVSSAKNGAAKVDSFVQANPTLGHRTLVAPSAARIYDAKDFGKY